MLPNKVTVRFSGKSSTNMFFLNVSIYLFQLRGKAKYRNSRDTRKQEYLLWHKKVGYLLEYVRSTCIYAENKVNSKLFFLLVWPDFVTNITFAHEIRAAKFLNSTKYSSTVVLNIFGRESGSRLQILVIFSSYTKFVPPFSRCLTEIRRRFTRQSESEFMLKCTVQMK